MVQPKTRRLVTEDALQKFMNTQAAEPVATLAALPAASSANRGLIRFVTAENEPYYSNGTSWSSIAQGAQGSPGPAGAGVPSGGEPLQIVRKNSVGTTTEWATLTKSLVGLSNVDNTSDMSKPISIMQKLALDEKASATSLTNGLSGKADLSNGKVPVSQLPTDALVTDANVAAVVDGAQTGAAIDQRITTQATPLVQPIVADYIASSQVVVDAAAAAVDANPKITELEEAKWNRGTLSAGSADSLTLPGHYAVTTSVVTGLPVSAPGHLEVTPTQHPVQIFTVWGKPQQYIRWTIGGVWQPWQSLQHDKGQAPKPLNELMDVGEYFYAASNTADSPFLGSWIAVTVKKNGSTSNVFQTAHSSGAKPRVATRTWSNSSQTWTPWSYFVLGEKDAEYLTTSSLSEITAGLGGNGTGTKLVPLAMTQMGIGSPEATTEGAVRWCRRYAVAPTRVRVHLANYNSGWSPWTGADMQIDSITIGKGTATGTVENPVTVSTTGTIPGTTGEYVSRWVDVALNDGEYIAVTVAWTGGDGATTDLQYFQGGGWTTSVASNAISGTVDGWARTKTTPFFAWIEAEVPASTPVVMGHGTSTVTGTASTDPVGDSFVAKYAYEQGALPLMLTRHGSTFSSWGSDTALWGMYPGINLKSIVDATVTYVGGNDLAESGITVAEMQARFTSFLSVLATKVKGPVYLGTLSPSNKASDVEALRRTVNTWLKGLPSGLRGTFDFAAAIGDAQDEDLNPIYSADGLHPNTAGQQKLADFITANPVTPYVLAPSKLKALAALL